MCEFCEIKKKKIIYEDDHMVIAKEVGEFVVFLKIHRHYISLIQKAHILSKSFVYVKEFRDGKLFADFPKIEEGEHWHMFLRRGDEKDSDVF